MATESWNNITEGVTNLSGKFSINNNGLKWESNDSEEQPIEMASSELSGAQITWLSARPKCQLRVLTASGSTKRFYGFRGNDRDKIKQFFPKDNLTFNTEEPAINGQNFGHLTCTDKTITFENEDKVAFEMPAKDISQVIYKAPNQIEIQIEESGVSRNKDDAQLVQLNFWVPTENLEEEDEAEGADETSTWGSQLQAKMMAEADIQSATGDLVTQFPDTVGTFKSPRGRYSIEMYQKFFRLYGSTYNDKIKYDEISALFLLNHPDYKEHSFVISLKEGKNVIQGNQRYQHLVMSMKADKELTADVFLNEAECIKQYGKDSHGEAALKPRMTGDLHTLVATIFKVLTKKKVYVSGKYKNFRGGDAIHATMKTHSGLLFPLQRNLLFIHRPTTFIRYGDIQNVEFERYTGSKGASHTFDLRIRCRSVGGEQPREYFFSGIGRDEYTNLLTFFMGKNVNVVGARYADPHTKSGRRTNRVNYAGQDGGVSSEEEDVEADDDEEDGDFKVDEHSESSSADSDDEIDEESDEDGDVDDSASDEDDDMKGRQTKATKRKRTSKKGGSSKKKKRVSKSKVPIGSNGKKKRKKKDPNAPKRPLSAYFIFMGKKRTEVKEQNADLSTAQVAKKLGAMWKTMTPEDKKVYDDEAAKLKADYLVVKAEYDKNKPPSEWETDESDSGKKGKKKSPYPDPPKRGLSAYMFYVADMRNSVKEANPNLSFGDLSKLIGQNWKNSGDDVKTKFNAKAAEDKKRYEVERKKWESEKRSIKAQRLLDGLTDSSGSDLSEDSSSSESSDDGASD